jgi:hypothetical protein
LGTWGTCFGGRGKVKIHENVMRTYENNNKYPTSPYCPGKRENLDPLLA